LTRIIEYRRQRMELMELRRIVRRRKLAMSPTGCDPQLWFRLLKAR